MKLLPLRILVQTTRLLISHCPYESASPTLHAWLPCSAEKKNGLSRTKSGRALDRLAGFAQPSSPVTPIDSVLAQGAGQRAVSEAISVLVHKPEEFAPFSYLLTKQQVNMLSKSARTKMWAMPTRYVIEVSTDVAYHPVDSRTNKDGLSLKQIAFILQQTYHKHAEVFPHWAYSNQYCFVNRKKSIPGRQEHPTLILEVQSKTGASQEAEGVYAIVPRTAYGATASKFARIEKQ